MDHREMKSEKIFHGRAGGLIVTRQPYRETGSGEKKKKWGGPTTHWEGEKKGG